MSTPYSESVCVCVLCMHLDPQVAMRMINMQTTKGCDHYSAQLQYNWIHAQCGGVPLVKASCLSLALYHT